MAKRALITGGAGFIGSHIVELFLDRGWAVEIVDDLSTGRLENIPAGTKLHRLDIRTEEAATIVARGGFDVVVHLAAQMDVRRSVADPVFDADVNVIGTLSLLEAIRTASARPRFIFASTGGVLYGDFVTPPNVETFAKDPESPYAISKLTVELYLAYYGRVHALEAVALRFGNVYGPRQDPHGEAGVVAIFCGRILDGRALTVFGTGEQTRDYVYVKDAAAAVLAAATKALPPMGKLDARGFNIGTGVGTTVNDVARTLLKVAGASTPIEFAPARPGEQLRSFLSVAKAAEGLGWSPSVSLEEGLRRTFEWFAARAQTQAVRA